MSIFTLFMESGRKSDIEKQMKAIWEVIKLHKIRLKTSEQLLNDYREHYNVCKNDVDKNYWMSMIDHEIGYSDGIKAAIRSDEEVLELLRLMHDRRR